MLSILHKFPLSSPQSPVRHTHLSFTDKKTGQVTHTTKATQLMWIWNWTLRPTWPVQYIFDSSKFTMQ